jgi:transcriptional regulator with GAF, ATPase, and Fis domain
MENNENMTEIETTKEISITHGNGSVQTIIVPIDFDESLLGPISISQEDLDSALIKNKIEENVKYLAETDWYVTRKAETGVEIPQEVLAKRQEAREFISENRE